MGISLLSTIRLETGNLAQLYDELFGLVLIVFSLQ